MKATYFITEHGVTQGLLGAFINCPQQTYWMTKGYVPAGTSRRVFVFGSIVHETLDGIYSGKKFSKAWSEAVKKVHVEMPQDPQYVEEQSARALPATEFYMARYFKSDVERFERIECERVFCVPVLIRGDRIPLRGKIDRLLKCKDGTYWLLETKTSSRISAGNLVDTIPFDLQIRFYSAAIERLLGIKLSGVIYDLVRNPGLKLNQGESIRDYNQRCTTYFEKNKHTTFYRFPIAFEKDTVKGFEREIVRDLELFWDWWHHLLPTSRNTCSCVNKWGRCKFLAACAGRLDIAYERKPFEYTELREVS